MAKQVGNGIGHQLRRTTWYLVLFLSIFGLAGMAFIAVKGAGKRAPLPNLALERYLDEAAISQPISVLIVRNKYEIFDYHRPSEKNRESSYPMGRLTDLLVSMAVMVLHDRGQLNIDDPLDSVLDGLPPQTGAIPLHHLLNHTSGLTSSSPDMPEPGARVAFAARNYHLLNDVIEKVTNQSVAQFIGAAILTPLEMTATRYDNGSWWTATGDLLKFEQSLYSNRLVSLKALRAVTKSSRLNDGTQGRYLAGWEVRNYKGLRLERATGETAAICRFPNKNFTAIILAEDGVAPEKIEALAIAVMDIYLGREMPAPKLPFS